MSILSKDFWTYAGERAIKTVAQTATAFLGTGVIGIMQIDWQGIISVSLGAGLISILTSIQGFSKVEETD